MTTLKKPLDNFMKYCLAFVIALVIVISFIPSVINTKWGTKQVNSWMLSLNMGHIQIDSFQLNWTSQQFIHGVVLSDPTRPPIIIENITIKTPLWILLKQSIAQLLKYNSSLKIELEGEILYQGKQSPFNLDLNFEKRNIVDWKDLQEAKIQVDVIDFPIDVIDYFSARGNPRLFGLFPSLLGSHLSIHINKLQNADGAFNIAVLSPSTTLNFDGQVVDGYCMLNKTATLNFTRDEEPFNKFPYGFKLAKPLHLQIELLKLSLPLYFLDGQTPLNLFDAGCEGSLKISTTDLELFRMGILNVDFVTCAIDASINSTKARCKVQAHMEYYKKPININYDAPHNKPLDWKELLNNKASKFLKNINHTTP